MIQDFSYSFYLGFCLVSRISITYQRDDNAFSLVSVEQKSSWEAHNNSATQKWPFYANQSFIFVFTRVRHWTHSFLFELYAPPITSSLILSL
jgi:hypothetical protein